MSSLVQCPAVGDLYDPGFSSPLSLIKNRGMLVDVEKGFLDNFFRLAVVMQNPECDAVYQAGISAKQCLKSSGIFGLQASHQLFVAGGPDRFRFRKRYRISLAPGPSQGKSQRA